MLALVFLSAAIGQGPADEARPVAEKYLIEGRLAEGEKALGDLLARDPRDDQARFGLGTVQFVRAVERMVQTFHKFGLRPDVAGGAIPFARLPIPANPKPDPIGYTDLRALFLAWNDDLARAEATLAGVVDDKVKLPLRFGLIRIDMDGDGKVSGDERLWKLYARLNTRVNATITTLDAEKVEIRFDRGDVAWLRGYCHLLMTFGEVYLAHDAASLFDHSAHLFYARPKTPFPFLKPVTPQEMQGFDPKFISDAIAFVHLLRFPVKEPGRMASALRHMEAVIALSRESWKHYLAEPDDDHEWIPNPKQDTVVPGGKVSQEMVQGWFEFLDETEAILAGKALLPFWRDAGGKGINLRRVFTEPRDLDPILWAQGTAAAPFLEDGRVTRPEVWQRLQRVFRGEFLGFALWFN
jgi:hypothetical protein